MLSSQALNVGRSLGVYSKNGEIYIQLRFGDSTSKDVWKPAIGGIVRAEQGLDNAVDKFAAKVVKNNETVGHLLCEYSQILWYLIIARGGKNCKQLCGGMGIPCRLVFSSSTRVKIDR